MRPFAAPLHWDGVVALERDLAAACLDGSSQIRHVAMGEEPLTKWVGRIKGWASRRTVVVLAPPALADGRALAAALAGVPCVLMHQSLDASSVDSPAEFRLGAWTRQDKHRIAGAWLREQDCPAALHVGSQPPLLDIPHVSVSGADQAVVLRRVAELPPGSALLLEAGGEFNRGVCAAVDARTKCLFLNGNPDLRDVTIATRCTEVVSNLPERLGPGLAVLLARVRPLGGDAARDVAGMLAWRMDALDLVRNCCLELRQRRMAMSTANLVSRIRAFDGSSRVFHGLHRPLWFDAAGSNLARELVLASPDGAGHRHALDRQPSEVNRSDTVLTPTLDVDVDLISISGVDAAAGTFRAEAVIRVRSVAELGCAAPADCLRLLNACGDEHWTILSNHHSSLDPHSLDAIVRGEFTFEPDLRRYPFDEQVLTMRLAAAGTHEHRVLRPIEGAADVDCRIPGWLVRGPHRAVTADARPAPGRQAHVVSGMEFGIRVARATDDIKRRVALPLALIVGLAVAIVLTRGDEGWRQNQAELLSGLFLAAVALYFSEPRPAPGVRTMVDAAFVRAFLFITMLLLTVMLDLHLSHRWTALPWVGLIASTVVCGATLAGRSWRSSVIGGLARRRRFGRSAN